ncbi:MAG: hypothetical protein DHS20C18_32230 [Saprospiraceae bacterium]|nr:MAG: hypothetical protein DHS20C18_32230 [Saprospiraceae bacterium]
MKTNSRIRRQFINQPSPNNAVSDPSFIETAGKNQIKTIPPDYSSMMAEIEKVSDPVSFEELKAFYGLV